MPTIDDLKDLAFEAGIAMAKPQEIIDEATSSVSARYGNSKREIKASFDELVYETEAEAERLYFRHEKKYGRAVLKLMIRRLTAEGRIEKVADVGAELGKHFRPLDRFFLSLAQSRRARAGKALEEIIRSLFRQLEYPFDEQRVINGKPDFIMPSEAHFNANALDCIVFTVKRTLRERWRQITTEGSRGVAFYLATIDEEISESQLDEMNTNKIWVVCPVRVKDAYYADSKNVLSFKSFFTDHLDPAMERWLRNEIL